MLQSKFAPLLAAAALAIAPAGAAAQSASPAPPMPAPTPPPTVMTMAPAPAPSPMSEPTNAPSTSAPLDDGADLRADARTVRELERLTR